jgi:hypothetical protein
LLLAGVMTTRQDGQDEIQFRCAPEVYKQDQDIGVGIRLQTRHGQYVVMGVVLWDGGLCIPEQAGRGERRETCVWDGWTTYSAYTEKYRRSKLI